ncbi:hypothetical protein B7P43_G12877 [Cryptotermes secundus]|uniref:Uncharacterized protein n=1 Tax=Cryptotermes secundus TaxID=105785 RepID=A0A2J7QPF1_9NEOP|nr:hypothetical protein B7P43_G12877 [Cryptotermes secundus]
MHTQKLANNLCKVCFGLRVVRRMTGLELLIYIKSNSNDFTTNSGLHSYNIRKKDNLHIVPCNTSLCKNNFNNAGLRLLNHLPPYIKEIPVLYKFKNALKTYLLDHCFYKVDEFLSCETNTNQL